MYLNIRKHFFQSLRDDFQAHLTPELKRMAREPESRSSPHTVAQTLQKLETHHGRAVLKLDTGHGSWAFIRSLLACTKPYFWRALVYMFITTAAAAAPPLLIEQVMTRFDAIKANPWLTANLVLLLLFPAVIYLTNITFQRYLKAFLHAHALQRSALMQAFAQKWARLDPRIRHELPQGTVQNLMQVDVPAVSHAVERIVDALMVLVHISIATALLWRYLGATASVGLALMALTVPILKAIVRKTSKRQSELLQARDRRLDLLSQILSAIKVIKLSGWSDIFHSRTRRTRSDEVDKLIAVMLLQTRASLLFSCAGLVVATVTYGVHILRGGELHAAMLLPTLLIFQDLEFPFMVLSDVASILAQTDVSAKRLLEFFNLKDETPAQAARPADPVSLRLQDLEFSVDAQRAILNKLTFELSPGQSLAIVGPIGAGKTVLLRTLLAEYAATAGALQWAGKPQFAYCPQEPFIASGTLRDNLTLYGEGDHLSDSCLLRALQLVGLAHEVSQWSAGLDTEIGERGLNLSGGQKQRVSLARAALHPANVVLLDDPFSALDVATERHVVDTLVFGEWKDQLRICVTHRLAHLERFDRILFIDANGNGAYGTLPQLQASNAQFSNYLRIELQGQSDQDTVLLQLGQPAASAAEKEESLTGSETQSLGKIRGSVWRDVLLTLGDSSWAGHARSGACLVLGLMLLASALPMSQQVLMSRMEGAQALSPADFLMAFALLTVVILGVTYTAQATFRRACAHTAQKAHDNMLAGVMHSPLRFFETTPSGRMMNRFSADIQQLDVDLASRGFRFTQLGTGAAASALGVIGVTGLAVIPFAIASYCAVRISRLYGIAVRENARLASVTRSPVFTLFNDGLRGHSTLRAFGRASHVVQRFDTANQRSLNTELRSWDLSFWLSIRLTLVSCALMGCLLLPLFVTSPSAWLPSLGAGSFGLLLALTFGLLGKIERLCRDFFALATVLVPWERCQQWAQLEPEESATAGGPVVPADWPSAGRIEFRHASLHYAPELPAVVSDADFTVAPRTHVALMGRTGAGKSTVLLALLRTLHVARGEILVDGINIQDVSPTRLRQSIAYVPQEPVLFLGPLRESIDITGAYSDADIHAALTHIGLGPFVASLPLGLSTPLEEGGRNISAGQRQLICLARAMLSRARIVLMDEATASVDVETDALIRAAIQKHLRNTSILLIAHRPSSLALCDQLIHVEHSRTTTVDRVPAN